MAYRIPASLIEEENKTLAAGQAEDYAALGQRFERARVDIEAITRKVATFAVAVPTWGVGTGGTRFARFPGPGEPRGIVDKLEDCATIHQLTRATPTCSPHFPWDKVDDYKRACRTRRGARRRLRRRQLEHLSGCAGSEALLQVRLAQPQREGRARSGGRAQCRMHRNRPEAGVEGADGVDRRRFEFSRAIEPQPRVRLVPRIDGRDLRAPARRTGACSSSTSSTSPRSIRR